MRGNFFFAELLLSGGILFFPLAAPRLYTAPPEEWLSPAQPGSPALPAGSAAVLLAETGIAETGNAETGAAPNTGAAGPPSPSPASLARAFYGGKSGAREAAPQSPAPAGGNAPLSEPGPAEVSPPENLPGQTQERAQERTHIPGTLRYVGRIRDGENRERFYIKDPRTGELITVEAENAKEGAYRLLENTPDTLVFAAGDLVYRIQKEQP
jgi:hypothetical protein